MATRHDDDRKKGAAQSLAARDQSLEEHERGTLRLRLRRRLDGKDLVDLPSRSPAAPARPFQSPALVTSSMPRVQEMAGGRWDTSSLIARLAATDRS